MGLPALTGHCENQLFTDYHPKLFAHELRRRHSVSDPEKRAGASLDAQVDLNPHQVEAALFAFKSPLSKGAILADEVGLGKTIEAGLVLAQKWTEGKRRILIICPANLRKQWSQELADKFFLPATILESANYNRMRKDGVRHPFERPSIVICSFQFAARQSKELMVTKWNLVVIDEANRLAACAALGVSRASVQRQRAHLAALSLLQRQVVLVPLYEPRFADQAPAEIYAGLLDQGVYHCSIRTMYRILSQHAEVRERRRQLRHPIYQKPELLAISPNQVWSWDITKLIGPVKWTYFYLYVILDNAKTFCRHFFDWYNQDHHHTGIGLMTPNQVHYGQAEQVYAARQITLDHAFRQNPERFVNKAPTPPEKPTAAWINPPISRLNVQA
jgi:SNF2-related domain